MNTLVLSLAPRTDTRMEPRTAAAPMAALERFLRDIEARALRIAELSTGNREDALDLVQDAMLAFARRYAARPEAEWRPLFHRVLDSRLLDHHRRRTVRQRWRSLLGRASEADTDALAQPVDPDSAQPWQHLADGELLRALEQGLRALPQRQRQAFLLRVWEGLDVAETACAMGCGHGSVKTHLSRALAALRPRLEAFR